MVDALVERTKRKWVGLLLTTLLGIAATVGVGWYQLSQAEKQAALAEEERARGVRQGLVSIVEEHVLNDKPIELSRLARLVDQRRREEHVTPGITLSEILEQAEFNILNSRYLAFDRKQTLKSVFDTLYSELSTRSFARYSAETVNADLLNQLALQIQEGKSSDALESLKRLQEAHDRDLETSNSRKPAAGLIDAFREVFKNPGPFVPIIVMIYFLIIGWSVKPVRIALRTFLRAREDTSLAPLAIPAEYVEQADSYRSGYEAGRGGAPPLPVDQFKDDVIFEAYSSGWDKGKQARQ